jgi:NitT/TauT family transport system permease protein
VVIGAWQLIVAFAGYAPFLLPGPLDVGIRFVRAWTDGTMTPHAWTTLQEVLLGFLVGAGLGVPVGILLARSRFAARLLSPYIVAAQAMPILALAPLIALWFGTGLLSSRHLRADGFLPVAVSTMVIRSVDRGWSRWAAPSGPAATSSSAGSSCRRSPTPSSVACASAPRWRSLAPSSASGLA